MQQAVDNAVVMERLTSLAEDVSEIKSRMADLASVTVNMARLEEKHEGHSGALGRAFGDIKELDKRVNKIEVEQPLTRLVRGWVLSGIIGVVTLLAVQAFGMLWVVSQQNQKRVSLENQRGGRTAPHAAHVGMVAVDDCSSADGVVVITVTVPGGCVETRAGNAGGGDGLLGGPRFVPASDGQAAAGHAARSTERSASAGAGAGAGGNRAWHDAGNLIPRDAERYRRDLLRNARAVWGMDAPVAVFAAQVHQESGWRPDARSKFAAGLAQFTPDTAEWISRQYGTELGANQPANPAWALRALVRYDSWLHARLHAAAGCERMAMTLAAYNGGLGWVQRDQVLAAARGADQQRWFGHVALHSARAAWAFEENRGYPQRILVQLQPRYLAWGQGVVC